MLASNDIERFVLRQQSAERSRGHRHPAHERSGVGARPNHWPATTRRLCGAPALRPGLRSCKRIRSS